MDKQLRSNLVLIGMPGAGKSTVGIILAKLTSRDFVDTDVLIQTTQKRTLQNIVDTLGHEELRRLEAETLCGLSIRNCIIATGGSAVYSHEGMTHLASEGIVIFLDVELPVLETRIHNYRTRGLAKRADQTFADLFQERCALYSKYAEITIICAGLTHEEVCLKIIGRVRELQS